jgi:hypothetical protein
MDIAARSPWWEKTMGQANRKRETHAALLAKGLGCIYCAGENVATTIEDMSPRSMFEGKQRPKGLEFPACQTCNNNTGHSDLVAAMLSRAWPGAASEIQKRDLKKLLAAVSNNIPQVLSEMNIGRASEKIARKRHNIPVDAHPFRMDGPLLTAHLEAFAAKMGFALHYEVRGAAIPASGGVKPMWFSNMQAMTGQIPDILFQMLPSPSTLRQGAKSAGDQFLYSYATDESGHMLYFASFNESFAVGGITAVDRSIFLDEHDDRFSVIRPGQFRRQV